ncbi:nucleotide exchange factor GrpE [Mobilicoccus pelagius]|uniref:Protein GrpE n=1 Tax=Mobilicoccus pelagius NBRC 104925 TaxID=1089455 RepID=H5UPQ6_9MICO|nr:nucleotide exchange factor GrpE [Mobilicoccus pelagius]GAB47714.1 protein GrpE [Mobilicoccus pelagius NBRC 104925]
MSTHDSQPDTEDHTAARPGRNPQPDGDADGMAHARPTSPATGAAAAAAARAAYAGVENTAAAEPAPDTGDGASVASGAEDGTLPDAAVQGDLTDPPTEDHPAQESAPQGGQSDTERLAAERLADYQRLNAEYVNYKRRVDRDRADDRKRATADVVESLLPVLDEIYFARQHGELTEDSPFAKIATKLESILAGHGVTMYGEVGETFDPTVHEALMHTTADLPPGTTDTTVVMVMQPGFRMGDRVVRAARVSVADPA